MESAFGIDHGYEIEKGILSAIGGGIGQKAVSAGSSMRRGGAAALRQGAPKHGLGLNVNAAKGGSGFAPWKPNTQTGAKALGNKAKVKVGGALGRVGGFAQRNQAATGALAVGGTTAGVGGGGFALGNRRQQ